MKSLEHKTGLIFDLFFSVGIMPLLIILGPPRFWWDVSPVFTCLAISYMYGWYFATRFLGLPKLILSKSYYKIAIIVILSIALTYILTLYPLPELDFIIPSMSEYQTRVRNYNMAISVWLMFTVVMCYSLTVAFIKELYHRMLLQNIVEHQRDKAELALYKAQINPHFLFNTLNSLYSLIIGTSQKAEDAFIKFTELLKYTYVTAENDWVTINDEINYINNYIDLQLIRLDGHTNVVREWRVDNNDAIIPPMIFLTFVENAFKYGTSTSKKCDIVIKLLLDEGMLRFETENRIIKHSDEFRENMPIGINNCRSRLSVLFPGRYNLDIKEEGGVFRVFLQINLNHERYDKMCGH